MAGYFEAIKELLLPGDRFTVSYVDRAGELGISVNSLKTGVFRARRAFGRLLREEVELTVSSGADVQEELHYVIQLISREDLHATIRDS